MQTRYGTDRVTPGNQSLGKPEIKRFDAQIQDQYNQLQARRRQLNDRLAAVLSKQKQIITNLGGWVAEGCEYKEYTDQLAELRGEGEALQAGLDYLDGQAGLLKRQHTWLSTSQ